MMNGGDPYELAKILGDLNIKMTQRYESWSGSTSPGPRRGKFGKLLEQSARPFWKTDVRVLFALRKFYTFLTIAKLLKGLVDQGRNRTAHHANVHDARRED